jgi:hypothetical protein
MKILLTFAAAAAVTTMALSVPAAAGTGCKAEEPFIASTKATNCRNLAHMGLYGSRARGAFAYAPPPRRVVLRQHRGFIGDRGDVGVKGGAAN